MRTLALVCLLCYAAAAVAAFQPLPVQRSAAETEFADAIAKTDVDSLKLKLAKDALEQNPENIPLGRAAQDIILKLMDNAESYFKTRAEASESIAAHYLYAWAANDTLITAREAAWILKQKPNDFWGHLLNAIGEWDKSKPDTVIVRSRLLAAINADPSRPEGYLYLGYFYQDEERWPEALEVFEAGAVCDPAHKSIRDGRLTTYAELRDADKYFKLLAGMYSDKPLEADLPRAHGTARFTSADLRGAPTVLEYWAYT